MKMTRRDEAKSRRVAAEAIRRLIQSAARPTRSPPRRMPPPPGPGPAAHPGAPTQMPPGWQPPPSSSAPSPWRALVTADGPHRGRTYYHNAATGETTWTRPKDAPPPPPVAPPVAPAAAPARRQIAIPGTAWIEVAQVSGPSYFHHPPSGEVRSLHWSPYYPVRVVNAVP